MGLGLGLVAGLGYWYFWGCNEGCPIRSNPWSSMAYGALLGATLLNIFEKKPQNQ